jgi:hypothetical protein
MPPIRGGEIGWCLKRALRRNSNRLLSDRIRITMEAWQNQTI